MKTRVLVLWKKVGDVYRAYATRYPDITAEGSSPEDVERKMREIIAQRLTDLANGNGNGSGGDLDIFVVEDERPECKPLPFRNWEGNEIIPDIDDYTYEIMIEYERRRKPEMSSEEAMEMHEELLRTRRRNKDGNGIPHKKLWPNSIDSTTNTEPV